MQVIGKKAKQRLIAGTFTTIIIVMLILVGPANAFVVNMGSFSDSSPKKGKTISFTFDIDISSQERLNITNIYLYSNEEVICVFNAKGEAVTSCEGITISKLGYSNAEWGYSYGYGYGYGYNGANSKLAYNVSIDTTNFELGEYYLNLVVATSNAGSISSSKERLVVSSFGGAEKVYFLPIEGNKKIGNSSIGIELNLVLPGYFDGNITIEEYTEKPEGTSFMIELGKYFVIEAEKYVLDALEDNAEIRVFYTDEDVKAKGIEETSLRLYYWNGTSWELPFMSGVNTAQNYVWARTKHFSTWGVFGSDSPLPPPSKVSVPQSSESGGRCNTQWTCTEWSSCNNGIQTRICSYPQKSCKPTNAKPIEFRTCVAESQSLIPQEEIKTNNAPTNPSPKGRTFLTGFVTGVGDFIGSVAGAITIVLFLVILGSSVWLIKRIKHS